MSNIEHDHWKKYHVRIIDRISPHITEAEVQGVTKSLPVLLLV